MGQNSEGKRHPISRKGIDQMKKDLRDGKFDQMGEGDVLVACGERGCKWEHLGEKVRVVGVTNDGHCYQLQYADGTKFCWIDPAVPDARGVYWKHASA